jgi:hypothetical protein
MMKSVFSTNQKMCVFQRLPAVLSRIGVILASPLVSDNPMNHPKKNTNKIKFHSFVFYSLGF